MASPVYKILLLFPSFLIPVASLTLVLFTFDCKASRICGVPSPCLQPPHLKSRFAHQSPHETAVWQIFQWLPRFLSPLTTWYLTSLTSAPLEPSASLASVTQKVLCFSFFFLVKFLFSPHWLFHSLCWPTAHGEEGNFLLLKLLTLVLTQVQSLLLLLYFFLSEVFHSHGFSSHRT